LTPPHALLEGAWPWWLAALEFAPNSAHRATVVYPTRWNPELKRNALTVKDEVVRVMGAEPLELPSGQVLAWRVELGQAKIWYASEPPHTLLRYDDGFLVWVLEK